MKQLYLLIVCVAVQLFGVIAFAAIDQQYVPATTNGGAGVGILFGNSPIFERAQTFTVGTTGVLTGFDAWVTRTQNVTLPLLFDIRRTVSGAPTEPNSGPDILASGSLDASLFGISDVTTVTPSVLPHAELNAQSFSVTAGDVLAITLRSNAVAPDFGISPYSWRSNIPADYPNGAAFFRRTDGTGLWESAQQAQDSVFRTYVTAVPEPSSVITALSLVCTARTRRPAFGFTKHS